MEFTTVNLARGQRPRSASKPASVALSVIAVAVLAFAAVTGPSRAFAAEALVDLGTATTYSVLGGTTVTNTGPSVLGDDLGVSPGSSLMGFPPGIVLGAVHATDASAAQAQSDLTIAFDDAGGRATTASAGTDLVGRTPTSGVYTASSVLALNGTVTLDGQGDNNAVFIFQVGSDVTTGSSSTVAFTRDAHDACWRDRPRGGRERGNVALLRADGPFPGFERSPGGQRIYPARTLEVLQLIQTVRRLGFPLSTIAELFAASNLSPVDEVDRARRDALLVDVSERLADLDAIYHALLSGGQFPQRLPSQVDQQRIGV